MTGGMEHGASRTLRFERRGAVAWIALDRPAALNSVSPELVREFGEALDRIEADDALRCLVVTGSGRAFCAGADLKAVKAMGDAVELEAARAAFLAEAAALLCRIERLRLPVIAAVNGLALAGGLGTALVCDLVIGACSATRMPATA